MEEEYVCPYTGKYCVAIEEDEDVCMNCSIGMDNMIGQEF